MSKIIFSINGVRLEIYPHYNTKMNSRWTVNLHVKGKATKLLEGNIRKYQGLREERISKIGHKN